MSKKDFDITVGPSPQQRWRAFYRLWRIAYRDSMSLSFGDWMEFFWHDPHYYRWIQVAEYGDVRGSSNAFTMEAIGRMIRAGSKNPILWKMVHERRKELATHRLIREIFG